MSDACEACHLFAGGLGKLWRRHRKQLPGEIKDLAAELLLALRLHILPVQDLNKGCAIGNSRYDVRGIAQLLAHLAVKPVMNNAESILAPPKITISIADALPSVVASKCCHMLCDAAVPASAITCAELESKLLSQDMGRANGQHAPFVPFTGTAWNLNASEFVPSDVPCGGCGDDCYAHHGGQYNEVWLSCPFADQVTQYGYAPNQPLQAGMPLDDPELAAIEAQFQQFMWRQLVLRYQCLHSHQQRSLIWLLKVVLQSWRLHCQANVTQDVQYNSPMQVVACSANTALLNDQATGSCIYFDMSDGNASCDTELETVQYMSAPQELYQPANVGFPGFKSIVSAMTSYFCRNVATFWTHAAKAYYSSSFFAANFIWTRICVLSMCFCISFSSSLNYIGSFLHCCHGAIAVCLSCCAKVCHAAFGFGFAAKSFNKTMNHFWRNNRYAAGMLEFLFSLHAWALFYYWAQDLDLMVVICAVVSIIWFFIAFAVRVSRVLNQVVVWIRNRQAEQAQALHRHEVKHILMEGSNGQSHIFICDPNHVPRLAVSSARTRHANISRP